MGILKSSAITIVVAFFLASCNHGSVSLDSTTARGEVPQLGNLVFRFSNALMPDSLLNNWDSTEYISFKPAIHGRFRWQGPDELVFSPSKPLLPATTYKAEIEDEVLRYTKYNKVKEAEAISFHTAPLQLDDAQVTWVLTDEGSRAIAPQLQLHFNYTVKTDDLKEKLHVLVDGETTPFAIQNTGLGKALTLRLTGFKAADKTYETVVKIDKGVRPVEGKNTTEEALETTLSIPSPFVLNVNSVEAEHDGTQGIVRIYTSQQVAPQALAALIQFHPAVKYTAATDEYGIILRSDAFDADQAYTFTVAKGLRGTVGGTLREDYSGSAAFGDLESSIQFTNSKAMYLSKSGSANIEVRITNVPKVKLILSKIYENNLLMAQRSGYYPRDAADDEPRYSSYEEGGEPEYSEATAGDIIYTKEIDTRSLPKRNGAFILNISQFDDRLPEVRGIYHVSLRSVKDYWIGDSRFISLSDIGLIAKRGTDKVFVFANSIKSATPLNALTVNVYGGNNQLLGTGATNGDGVAEIQLVKKDFAGFAPAMVIAKSADDFTYLPFNNTKVNTSRFDVGGKRGNATGLDAFVYAERDIYRPGETLHYAVVLRDKAWKSPGAIPVKLKFSFPNGKEWQTLRKGLNEQGAAEGSVAIAPAAITGSYLMEVYTSNDVLLASKNFMIEEFMPDRIRVNTTLSKPSLQPADQVQLTVNAKNFFGPPAANRNWETEIQVKAKTFSTAQYRDYDFDLTNAQTLFEKEVREGKTDEAGNAVIDYTVPALYKNTGLLQTAFYTTVFDETGRPVSKYTTADIFTQPVFYGIKGDGYYYYPLNQAVPFALAVVDKAGKAASATANVQIIKHEYKTVLSKSGSYFRYDSQKEDKVLENKTITFTGQGTYTFIPRSPGDYEIRIYQPGAAAYVSKAFYSYGSWGGDQASFEVNTEGEIDIALDKEKYSSGEKAKLLFKTPFSGRMLVTTERDGVLSYQYIDVSKRSASMELSLDETAVPNLYVSATIFKPHAVSDIPLTVAHGVKNISVDAPGRKIAPQITAQKAVRSHTHQKVSVKAAPGSYVTLAAVDNGVLQVSDFKTPDPYGWFYQKAALGVQAYDMYPLLFPEVRARSSTGGDGDLELEKRINPMPAKRVKIVSYWSGLKKANSSGVADFEFDVPQFSGELRLMAVAFKDESFGASEAPMTVADPVVLSAALPRFLSPGDTALLPVTITNTTSKATSGQATIKVDGPFKIIGNVSQNISLNAASETTALFEIVAAPNIGVGKITTTVNALGERFTDETEMAVRPPSTLQKRTGSGSVVGGAVQRLQLPSNNFMAGSTRYELVVSTSPVAELSAQLKYLVQYPYGCTEQVVSSAFPQLYYADFVNKQAWGFEKAQAANSNVQEAIRRIALRQLYNGAVMLWDNEGTENWWTTVYAAHFLIEAKRAGFDVDNSLLETMLSYIAARLKTKSTIAYYYNRDQQRKIAPKEVPYSLYVLALANRAQVSSMNYYKAAPQLLALDGKYLLSAAYAVAGDKRQFAQFLPTSFSGEVSVKQTGGSFYSPLRDEAVALNALLDADPGNAQVPVMAKHISDRLKGEPYLNTQEQAFSFLALGKLARSAAASNVTAEIRSGGNVIGKIDGNTDWKSRKGELQAGAIEISTKGNGRLYYSWQAEGISATGSYKEEDNFLKVRRTFYDRYGRVITANNFKQNDLVIVGITLEKSFDAPVENIVLTDLLPAGFEIENPRTKELPGMEWIKNASEPTALDVRDDRIHFFVDAASSKQNYYYAVRAVSLGTFKQGPVSADAMYNGEYHSYHGAGVVQVTR